MPSVGMRRTTRVFGVVKGVDGARVLRSGRRLYPQSVEAKLRKHNDGDDLYRLSKREGNGNVGRDGGLDNKWIPDVDLQVVPAFNILGAKDECKIKSLKPMNSSSVGGAVVCEDRMFGNAYSRKRKRIGTQSNPIYGDFEIERRRGSLCDRLGKVQFFLRQKIEDGDSEGLSIDSNVGTLRQHVSSQRSSGLTVLAETSSSRSGCIAGVMHSVLMYMRRARLTMTQLTSFLLSEPLNGVFFGHGIRFLKGSSPTISSGFCMFFGTKQLMPLFSVDFSAIPICFMSIHSTMFLRFSCQQSIFENKQIDVEIDVKTMTDSDGEEDCSDHHHLLKSESILPDCRPMAHKVDHTEKKSVSHPSIRAFKLAGRNMLYRNILSSRIQKRRSSLKRRGRIPSMVSICKTNGFFFSEEVHDGKNGISVEFSNKKRQSGWSNAATKLKKLSSAMVNSTQQYIDPTCCSANVVVIEPDKCYREGGAIIMLEISTSSECVLVVKKDGSTRFTHKAEKVMRPCTFNRFTHSILWTVDNSRKLEFLNREQWFIFKDLYKECYDRNLLAPTIKAIPIPGVSIMPDHVESNCIHFCRSDSYISLNGDEVSRAMAKRTANYDMDCDDEEWLNKFNAQGNVEKYLSEDDFETMIDTLEKGFYCSQDDFTDEKAVASLFSELGWNEVKEAVYSHWVKRRKQKGSPLLRIFQVHQAKKAPEIPKPLLRKKRSLKRQTSLFERYKQPAISAAQDILDIQTVKRKVEEATASANKLVEIATKKRLSAQFLMKNADLAMYKAIVASRLAKAAQVAESLDTTGSTSLMDGIWSS